MFAPKFLAKTDIVVRIFDGFDGNGSPVVVKEIPVKARIESSNSVVYDSKGQKVTLSQKAFIFEGFNDFYVNMTGRVLAGANEHDIAQVKQLLNPNGSVNHYVLGLV